MKNIILGLALFGTLGNVVYAGDTPRAQPIVVYKWVDSNGLVRYQLIPPRGVDNIEAINEQGIVISSGEELKPKSHRPSQKKESTSSKQNAKQEAAQAAADNSVNMVTREERCAIAKGNLKLIQENTVIHEEDGQGNLIMLSPEMIEQRRSEAQAQINKLCN